MDRTYLTLEEVAEDLGVHFNTAYRYVKVGYLKAVLIGNKYRIEREDLEKFKSTGIIRKE